jgi:16S rRNA (guanine527-N7)-methyltransferase
VKLLLVRVELISAIRSNQNVFDLDLSDDAVERLADYYELVLAHNPLLHLVAPCSPSEFAVRHILESLTLLGHLPRGAKFADVGAGGGLPSMPCLLVRDDLRAVLIESKEKKAKFLAEAIKHLGLENRAEIVNRQFEEADSTNCKFVTCRALDKFAGKLPRLLRWSGKRTKLFFGGPSLDAALQARRVECRRNLLPLSKQRYLFVCKS